MHCLGQPVCDMVSEGLPRELVFSKRVHLSDFPLQMVRSEPWFYEQLCSGLSNFSVLCYNCLRICSVSFHPRHFLRQQSYRFVIWQMRKRRLRKLKWLVRGHRTEEVACWSSRTVLPSSLVCCVPPHCPVESSPSERGGSMGCFVKRFLT